MPIVIDSLEYQCWHEVGHATVCLHLGGDVEFIELLDDQKAGGAARARCSTTPDIRQSVACGGFAAEFYLLRTGRLTQVDEKEIAQTIFRNAAIDREMFFDRKLGDGESFTKEEDEQFMNLATQIPRIFPQYSSRMQQIVSELLDKRKIDGKRVRELLFCSERA